MICWKCKKQIDVESVFRTTECPLCHADLHSCKQCKFFSPGSHYDCRESVMDIVSDKEKANFCDSFMVNQSISTDKSKDKASAARDAFNALFG